METSGMDGSFLALHDDGDDCDVESAVQTPVNPKNAVQLFESNRASHPLQCPPKTDSNPKKLSMSHSKSFFTYDDNLLHRAVADAGRWAYGTILVEVWALSEDHTLLTRPEAGWWVDPVYHRSCGEKCQICRLTNASRDDFLPPIPLTPGEGLPGVLWAEVCGDTNSFVNRKWFGSHHSRSRSRGRSGLPDLAAIFSGDANSPHPQHGSKQVVWREVNAIANDPDQPWNPRLQLLASLGLGWVAAVHFNLHGHSGIVMYLAREGVDLSRLQSESNEAYLIAAAGLAGAAYALRGPRRQIIGERRAELTSVFRRVRTKILALKRMGVSLETLVDEHSKKQVKQEMRLRKESTIARTAARLKERLKMMIRKTRGGGMHPPPAMSWKQSSLTFAGAFLTLIAVCRLNVSVIERFGVEYGIVLGPFGALATLLYGLTSAPASQPKNAVCAQIFSMAIAICIGYIDGLELWFRQALVTALAIAGMVKLGWTHPPAGASAMIFASVGLGWKSMLFMITGNVIALGTATIVNNLSDKRQYPSYWSIPFIDVDVENKKLKVKKIE